MSAQLQLSFSEANIQEASSQELQDEWSVPRLATGDPRQTSKAILKVFEKNYQYFGDWGRAFETILDVITHVLEQREQEYLELVNSLDKRAVNATSEIFAHLLNSFSCEYSIWDYLGEAYQDISSLSKSQAFGQFFTPIPVAEAMALMTLGDISQAIEESKRVGRRLTIHDPACGSGAMLLACKKAIIAQAGLRGLDYFEFSGQDLDSICVKMCAIQMRLTDYRFMTCFLLTKAYELQEQINKSKEAE